MLTVKDFDYFLPEERIAQTPVYPRDSSRLLVYNTKTMETEHRVFSDVYDYLKAGDVLVINNTKVIPARIFAKTPFGGKVELLLLRRLEGDDWEVMVKPGKKAKKGVVLTVDETLSVTVGDTLEEGLRRVTFSYQGVFEEVLSKVGTMPLPPYIRKKLEDQSRYQTVYGKINGSAAAPTAGLHFTPELLQKIKDKGVIVTEVLLHVGLGTFRPVKEEIVTDHVMHAEYYEVTKEAAEIVNLAKREGRRVIAVGTTSVRTLETVANEDGTITAGSGDTQIFLYPPYKMKCVEGLITNFHLPKSTLLMLVSCITGREELLKVYKEAVEREYRFFSFGDACLFL
ncbi:MAG: tRNA preQ1(34) S-adenosylmethionine ribosyltransferase-isomerase QueA [Clostridiales bacterium]|nr:tRNA preQ1(34) S-adenosylmethionine ribosyltransferase-isomerase QueA [Clostridiales bacterium]